MGVERTQAVTGMPFYTGSCRSLDPSLITPGVILEHVSAGPLGFPACTGKEKDYPCSSPPLIRSSLILKRVTLIQSRSLCVSVKILPSCTLPSRQVLNKIDSYAPKSRPRLIHALAGTNFTKQEYLNMKRIPWTKSRTVAGRFPQGKVFVLLFVSVFCLTRPHCQESTSCKE
jgi:hypothetical protein